MVPNCKIEISTDEAKKKPYRLRITWPSEGELGEESEDDDEEGDASALGGGKSQFESPRHGSAGDKGNSGSPGSLQTMSLDAIETPTSSSDAPSKGGKAPPKLLLKSKSTGSSHAAGTHKEKEKEKNKNGSGWWSSVFGGNSYGSSGQHGPLELACESYQDRDEWVVAFEQSKSFSQGDFVRGDLIAGARRNAPPGIRIKEVEDWLKTSEWKVCNVVEGVRVFELVGGGENLLKLASGSGTPKVVFQKNNKPYDSTDNYSSLIGYSEIPCYRVNVCVNSSPLQVLNAVMTLPTGCRTGNISQIRIVETLSSCADIVHITLGPIYVYPTWTAPRDLCLLRYWKQTADNSYMVCFDSTFHKDCPLVVGYVRAELHATYVISPPTKDHGDEGEEPVESLLTYIAQMDPRGWIWRSFGFQHAILRSFMLHVLDIRDAVDIDRFVKVHFDPSQERRSSVIISSSSSQQALAGLVECGCSSLGVIPPPTLPIEMWSEPDACTFRVRGKSYPQDKIKVLSAQSLFKLVAVDVFEVPEPTRNIAANPKNRVYLAQQRGDPAWCFVMNIMVPGPPHLCFVVYLEGDKKKIEEDTPFGRIARPFFYGNDDEFRNNHFKLIPRVSYCLLIFFPNKHFSNITSHQGFALSIVLSLPHYPIPFTRSWTVT